MQALVTTAGRAHPTRVTEVPEPAPPDDPVLIRTLEVGVCGTDREISEGLFGVAPEGLWLLRRPWAAAPDATLRGPAPPDTVGR